MRVSSCSVGSWLPSEQGPPPPARGWTARSNYLLMEYGVTDLLESSGWLELEVTARGGHSVVGGLPGHIIIERFGGSGISKVILAQEDMVADCGNLLEKHQTESDMAS